MSWGYLLSLVLNVVLAVALLFKSALNDVVVDSYKRFRDRREKRRALLCELHENMLGFSAKYMVLVAVAPLKQSGIPEVDAVADQLQGTFTGLFQASMEFLNRHEFEMPSAVRERIGELRTAMKVDDPRALVDPTAIEKRSSDVDRIVEEIEAEVRRLLT
jgi:hypothetical protein